MPLVCNSTLFVIKNKHLIFAKHCEWHSDIVTLAFCELEWQYSYYDFILYVYNIIYNINIDFCHSLVPNRKQMSLGHSVTLLSFLDWKNVVAYAIFLDIINNLCTTEISSEWTEKSSHTRRQNFPSVEKSFSLRGSKKSWIAAI